MRLILFIMFIFLINHVSLAKTCVISLFPKNSLLDHKISRVFSKSPNTVIIQPTTISEITKCFSQNEFRNILFLAHGIETNLNSSQYGAPIYFNNHQPIILPRRFFEKITDLVKNRKIKLTKVRFGFCGSKNSSIQPLTEYLSETDVAVEYSPEVKFYEQYFNSFASRLPLQWLSQSIDKTELSRWQTDQKSNCTSDIEEGCDRSIAEWVIPY